jgi:hypothetical protein
MSISVKQFFVATAQLCALALYMAVGYLYVISGLGVPAVFLLPLWAAWAALLAVGFSHRHDFRYLVAVPVGAATLWAAVALGLGAVLNWQA